MGHVHAIGHRQYRFDDLRTLLGGPASAPAPAPDSLATTPQERR
jgi:hypothetical protein